MDKKLIYEITLKLKDQISASINKVKKEFRAVDEAAEKAQSSTGHFQSVCEKISQLQFENMLAPLDRLAQSFSLLSDKGKEFEQSMEGFKTLQDASTIDAMTQAIIGTSVAQEQAAVQTDTLAEKVQRMQACLDEAKLALFTATGALAPYMAVLGEIIPVVSSLIPITQACAKAVTYLQQQHIAAKAAILGKMTVEKLATAATGLMTAAQTALNAVMSANPMALIGLAIIALVAGLIAAYRNCESFRKVVDTAWTAVKNLALAIWDSLVEAFEAISSALSPVWNKLKALLGIEEEVSAATTQTNVVIKGLADANGKAANDVNLLTSSLGNQGKALNRNLDTMGGVEQKISDLRIAQKNAMSEQAITLEKEIRLWQKKAESMQNAIRIGAADQPELTSLKAPENRGIDLEKAQATNPKGGNGDKPELVDQAPLHKIVSEIHKAQAQVGTFNDSIFGMNSAIGTWAGQATAGITHIVNLFGEFSETLKNDTLTTVQKVSGSLTAIGAIMGSMGNIVGGAAGSWLEWGANLLAMVAAAIPQLLELFGIQSSLAVATSATLPFPFNLLAMAATVAGIAAAVASIPKPAAFATGGVISGPTLALVGEYAGASNNPEVIAPLSKLKALIEPSSSLNGLRLETKIKGKDLYIALRNVEHEISRTR